MRTRAMLALLAIVMLMIGVILPACSTTAHRQQSVIGRWERVPERDANHVAQPQGAKELLNQLSRQRSSPEPAGTTPSPGTDEVWVIAKPSQPVQAEARGLEPFVEEPVPGTGSMFAFASHPQPAPDLEPRLVPLPLAHTQVAADIAGYVASVEVTQRFENPFDSKIEAVYVFPLPHDAAVNEFVMTIGDRRIRGIIREREEAERIYEQARAQGHRASLLTQERPNVFTQKVANIEPGKRIDVHIRYFHTLAYEDGSYAWHFPTVVGPRFNPPQSRGVSPRSDDTPGPTRPGSEGAADVAYLPPNERSGHDLSLSVKVDAGVAIEEIASASHRIEASERSATRRVVTLAKNDTIPNKDFVLRFRVAGDRIKSNVLTHRDKDGAGYFTMMVLPPVELASLPRRPVELIFVLDTSGSMNGRPLEQAKAAVAVALRALGPDDRFQVIRFSDDASAFGAAPVPATDENVRRALRRLDELEGQGGTMMIEGIHAALRFPREDASRLRFVCFLTDGYIGNEAEIFAAVQREIGDARIFGFGVGPSVNRHLLDGMARIGRGAVAYLGLPDDPRPVMADFLERIRRPAMTDVAIDFAGMEASDTFPRRVPDLFVGRPLIVTGRYTGELPRTVRVTGHAGNEPIHVDVPVAAASEAHEAIAALWARMQIESLSDRQAHTDDPHGELAGAIRRLALEHNLMSAYTAFVAVDASERTAGAYGTTVHQAVPVPEGVRYETAVSE